MRNRLNWTARYSWYSRRSLAASTNNTGFLCISSLRFQLRCCRNLARRAWLSTQAGVGFDKWRAEYNLVEKLLTCSFSCLPASSALFGAFRLLDFSAVHVVLHVVEFRRFAVVCAFRTFLYFSVFSTFRLSTFFTLLSTSCFAFRLINLLLFAFRCAFRCFQVFIQNLKARLRMGLVNTPGLLFQAYVWPQSPGLDRG